MEQSTSERNWAEQAPGPLAGYADDPPPFGGYAFMTAVFLTAFGGAMSAARASGREVLVGVASHKLSRLISKDRITSFVRAPFTEFQQHAGHAEVDEQPRGRGLRHSLGELLTCPFCLAQWVGTGFVFGYITAPRATRLAALTMTMVAGSDVLQFVYDSIQNGSLDPADHEPEPPR